HVAEDVVPFEHRAVVGQAVEGDAEVGGPGRVVGGVGAGTALQLVVPQAAVEHVVAVLPPQHVVAAAGDDRVVAGTAVGLDGEVEGAARHADGVVAGRYVDAGAADAARGDEQRAVEVGDEPRDDVGPRIQ